MPHTLRTCPWPMCSKPRKLSSSPISCPGTAPPEVCTHRRCALGSTVQGHWHPGTGQAASTAPGCIITHRTVRIQSVSLVLSWVTHPRGPGLQTNQTPGSFLIIPLPPFNTQLLQLPVTYDSPTNSSSSVSGQAQDTHTHACVHACTFACTSRVPGPGKVHTRSGVPEWD